MTFAESRRGAYPFTFAQLAPGPAVGEP